LVIEDAERITYKRTKGNLLVVGKGHFSHSQSHAFEGLLVQFLRKYESVTGYPLLYHMHFADNRGRRIS
jgi:hypothetical protein